MSAADDAQRLEDARVREAMKAMRAALRGIDETLAKGKGTEFDAAMALQRKRAILREIDALEKRLAEILKRGVTDAARLAARTPIEVHGETIDLDLGVDAEAVKQAQQSAAALVKDVGDEARKALNTAVTKTVSGVTDRVAFDQSIRDALGPDAMESRVERIARTEMGKAASAQQASIDERLAENPDVDLIKRWSASGKGAHRARPGHAAIDGQERELDEAFDLAGSATASTPPGGGGEHRPMQPLDAVLPAGDVVNCGCRTVRVPRAEARQPYIARENPRSRAPVTA